MYHCLRFWGFFSTASRYTPPKSGGYKNLAFGIASSVSVSVENTYSGDHSSVFAGEKNIASEYYSFVRGRQSTAFEYFFSLSGGKKGHGAGATRSRLTSFYQLWDAFSISGRDKNETPLPKQSVPLFLVS
uniref:Uncharacterized protein n=1 Tax=Corethron hystrix TaxID=216773 RepID=A0A7S1BIM0_9STRA|mmetsp:Transcript_28032/g.64172  ORF Transcript_28032/g.64172 Transcript_28032/m.64172 type:complete len:130 (+) Transcript_28032:518-907(+)